MTKKELIELNGILVKLSDFGKTKFKYAILKNIEILKPNIVVLSELEKAVKKHIAPLEQERDNLIIKIGKKNNDGSVFVDVEDKDMLELFNAEFTELLKNHQDSIGTYNGKMAEYQEILNEEIDEVFTFKTIPLDNLPENDLSMKTIEILEKFGIIAE